MQRIKTYTCILSSQFKFLFFTQYTCLFFYKLYNSYLSVFLKLLNVYSGYIQNRYMDSSPTSSIMQFILPLFDLTGRGTLYKATNTGLFYLLSLVF